MPPTRAKADFGPKRSLPFKPPSRLSGGASSSIDARSSSMKSQDRRTSGMSDSLARSVNTTIILSDEDDAEDDFMDEDEGEQSYLTTKANRRTTIQSRTGPSTPRRQSTNRLMPPEENPAAILEDNPDAPCIPRNLLVRILHENFEDKNMKINKEAMTVVESYVKVFIKEAIARSRQETRAKASKTGETYGDDWLQVEDLEKIAPQLMLDF